MRYFRTLLPPRQAPKNITNLKEIRERIIQFTLVAVIILGIFELIANLPLAISRAEWAYVAFYLFAFMVLLIMFLVRRIPYTIKALSIISILFVLGFTDVLESGLSGDGRIFLIISVLLATIFLGNTAGFISLFVSFASFAGIGIGMTTGKIPLPPVSIMTNSGNAGDWISGTIILVSMISLGLMALIITINGLDRSLSRQSNLSLALESQSTQLEKTVAHRTLDLEYRLGELRTASQISRLISNNLDPQSIMEQMANLLLDRFGLYYVGIFLTDETGRNAILRAGTGEAGQKMVAQNHQLTVGGASMIGWAISNRTARIALDAGAEAIRFNNPFLPLTRSEMALPLISRDLAVGAISLQSKQPEAFDTDDIAVLQGIADVFATALDNARLFQATQASLNEIKNLHQKYLEQAWTQTAESEGGLSYTYESDIPADVTKKYNPVVVPVTLRDQVIGQVILELGKEALSSEEKVFIDALAAQTAQALENARLLEATQRQVGQEQSLNQITSSFSTAFEVDDILRIAVQELGKLSKVTEVSVILTPPEIGELPTAVSTTDRQN